MTSAALFFGHLPPHFFDHLPPVHLPPIFFIFLFYIGKDQKKVGGDLGRGGGRQGGGGGQQVVKEVNKKLVKEFNAGLAKLYLCKVKSWRWSWMWWCMRLLTRR